MATAHVYVWQTASGWSVFCPALGIGRHAPTRELVLRGLRREIHEVLDEVETLYSRRDVHVIDGRPPQENA